MADTSVVHSEGTFKSPHGYNLCTQSWVPSGKPRAVIILNHGLAEHSGRYVPHGKSDAPHGKEIVVKFKELVDDAVAYAKDVLANYKDIPFIALGHSMGGCITIHMIYTEPTLFQYAVLCSPPIARPTFLSTPTYYVAKFLSKIAPKAKLVELDKSTLSRDPEIVKDYNEDPLNWKTAPNLGFGAHLLDYSEEAGRNADKFALPYLYIQGTADEIVNATAPHDFHEKSSSQDKTLIFFKDLYHELLHEPEKKFIHDYILTWLDDRVSGKKVETPFAAKSLATYRNEKKGFKLARL